MREGFDVSRPALLFYCQHSLGLGHAVRSFALAAALAKHFRVVVACGGELPDSIAPPDDVEVVVLPPLGASRDGQLISRGRFSLDGARRRRRALLLNTFHGLSPRVLVIELFPFGRRKFADELVPLLEAAAVAAPRVLVVSSVRDILVGRQPDQQAHDTLSCVLANRYFDAALVHSDPRFARLDESFRPSIPLEVPVFHTGFVVPDRDGRARPARERCVLVSVGGGLVGEPLLRAALDARPLLPQDLRLDLVAGPFLPEAAWRSLEASARMLEGVRLRRFVADLTAELGTAAASVSQCGYNTALDLLRAGVPALVVPFSEGREDEQTRRARRLERLGAVRVLAPERLDASTFAREVQELLRFRPRPPELDVDGARASARLLARLTGAGLSLREKATAL